MTVENIQEPAGAGHKRAYKVTIDKAPFDFHEPNPSGQDLLTRSGKVPVEQYAIYLKQKGSQPRRIKLDEHVDLRDPGVEHFVTLPLDQTEG